MNPESMGAQLDDRFRDRAEAGRLLVVALSSYAHRDDVVVLALPRGGVPVAFEIAQILGAPLDVFLVRKLGVPGHEELAMGALALGGIRVLNQEVVRQLGISQADIEHATDRERRELARRDEAYRRGRPPPQVGSKTLILVDDGLATGSTMRAAVVGLRQGQPGRIVVAVPVGPHRTCDDLRDVADEVVCLRTPVLFQAIGLWYEDFSQVTDEEVRSLLDRARAAREA